MARRQDDNAESAERAALKRMLQGPLAGFTERRDTEVSALRSAGFEGAARRTKRLRKPSLVVWALDQLSVRAPKKVKELLDVGAELQHTQARVFEVEPAHLHEIWKRHEAAVEAVVEEAAAALVEAGNRATTPVKERLVTSLRAVAGASPELREAFSEGRLVEELKPVSLEETLGLLAGAPKPKKKREAPSPLPHLNRKKLAAARTEAKEREQEKRRAQAVARRLATQAKLAEEALERARREAEAAREAAQTAKKRAERFDDHHNG